MSSDDERQAERENVLVPVRHVRHTWGPSSSTAYGREKVTAQPGEAVRAARNEGTKGEPTRAFFKASNARCPFLRAVEM